MSPSPADRAAAVHVRRRVPRLTVVSGGLDGPHRLRRRSMRRDWAALALLCSVCAGLVMLVLALAPWID